MGQFKYLSRVLKDSGDDNHAVDRQLKRTRKKWGREGKILSSQGAEPRAMSYFHKAILQSVLLLYVYGSESGLVTRVMVRVRVRVNSAFAPS